MSLVVWTFLLGALGALLAVPMTLLARAVSSTPTAASGVAPLIDAKVVDEPPPTKEEDAQHVHPEASASRPRRRARLTQDDLGTDRRTRRRCVDPWSRRCFS